MNKNVLVVFTGNDAGILPFFPIIGAQLRGRGKVPVFLVWLRAHWSYCGVLGGLFICGCRLLMMNKLAWSMESGSCWVCFFFFQKCSDKEKLYKSCNKSGSFVGADLKKIEGKRRRLK